MTLSIVNYLSNMDENSKLLLIIIAVISVLLILIFFFNHLSNKKEKYQSKIQKANKKRLFAEIEEESKNIEIPKKEYVKIEKPALEEPVKEIKKEETIETEEVIEVLQDENESDVDRILREIKAASKEDSINLTQFEKEQEETAIISYDELCKRAGVQKKIYKAPTKSNEVVETIKEEKIESSEKPKYKPSKIVSPIFGVQEENKSFMNLDNSMNEMDLDQTFLTSLKEFRNGLE